MQACFGQAIALLLVNNYVINVKAVSVHLPNIKSRCLGISLPPLRAYFKVLFCIIFSMIFPKKLNIIGLLFVTTMGLLPSFPIDIILASLKIFGKYNAVNVLFNISSSVSKQLRGMFMCVFFVIPLNPEVFSLNDLM